MSDSRPNYTPRPMSSATTYALGALALVVVVAIAIVAVRNGRQDELPVRNDGYGAVHNAAVVSVLGADGTILLGRPDAAKTIDIFEDPLCPACAMVERAYGQELAQRVDDGKLAIRYHYVNFLDKQSGSGDYSTRAIAAVECVAAAGSGPVYSQFQHTLFTSKQPKEGGDSDLTNQQLADIARESGAPADAVQCVVSGAKVEAAKANAKIASDALKVLNDGKVATPSVFDGTNRQDMNNHNWVAEVAGA
ncbi:thioredoxin domain-containing protein [Nocardia sp. XZ_19_385]|uniref:DsbA family protein n=1 Tax=Nocardia sp. XZ_19_385 TaxID=2769488 RepID=UPI002815F332|nr:thioredoxin domain-containing protein [Nocardia sp. XZ_19_385]